jgi:hypothetical protein
MSIIPNNNINVNNKANELSLVGKDRATLESDLSVLASPPTGVSPLAFFIFSDERGNLPQGLTDTSGGGVISDKLNLVSLEGDRLECEALDVPSSSLITSLDNSKHIGISYDDMHSISYADSYLFHIQPSVPIPRERHSVNTEWQAQNETLKEERERIADILLEAGRYEESRKVRYCGEDVIAYKASCCGDTVAYPMSCGHRLCPVCMRRRSARLATKVMNLIEGGFFLVPVKGEKGKKKRQYIKMKHPVLITLTKKNIPKLTKKVYSDFRRDITKLRHRDIFDKCEGGFYGIETTETYDFETHTWHVHAHMIADTKFIPQGMLSEAWRDITGDSYIVDIRVIKDAEKAGKEVAKYIVKPGDFLQDPKLVDEFLNAVKGARLISTFGKYHNIKFEDEDDCGLPDCSCKKNKWRRLDKFFSIGSVYKDIKGFYRLKAIISDG